MSGQKQVIKHRVTLTLKVKDGGANKYLEIPFTMSVLDDLVYALEEALGCWQQSKLKQQMYNEDYGVCDENPFWAVVGEFQFDQNQESLNSLSDIAAVCVSERFFCKRNRFDIKDSIPEISSHFQGKEYAPLCWI